MPFLECLFLFSGLPYCYITQCIRQDLKIGCPNLLFFEKLGVQMFNFQYICMYFTNKIESPFSKLGVQKTPKGIAG